MGESGIQHGIVVVTFFKSVWYYNLVAGECEAWSSYLLSTFREVLLVRISPKKKLLVRNEEKLKVFELLSYSRAWAL